MNTIKLFNIRMIKNGLLKNGKLYNYVMKYLLDNIIILILFVIYLFLFHLMIELKYSSNLYKTKKRNMYNLSKYLFKGITYFKMDLELLKLFLILI